MFSLRCASYDELVLFSAASVTKRVISLLAEKQKAVEKQPKPIETT